MGFVSVIIASVIGAGGLGGEVYKGLKALRIGERFSRQQAEKTAQILAQKLDLAVEEKAARTSTQTQ